MQTISYRFPTGIIQQAISLYLRFALSYRDVEDFLAERGITLSDLRLTSGSRRGTEPPRA